MPTSRRTFIASGAVLAAGAAVPEAVGAGPRRGKHPPKPPPKRKGDKRRKPRRRAVLSRAETVTLAAWCDRLAHGARAAEVGDFVNDQLAKHPDDALLGIRYFGWPPPWKPFYQAGIEGLDEAARAAHGERFAELRARQQDDVHARLQAGTLAWTAEVPFFLFYLVTRSDAVDVVYGTRAGFKSIGMRYDPVNPPRRPW